MDNLQDVLTLLVIILLVVGGGLGLLVNLVLSIGVLRDGIQLRAKGGRHEVRIPCGLGAGRPGREFPRSRALLAGPPLRLAQGRT